MAKQFAREACIVCPQQTGEHVWTEWFLSIFPPSQGPYTWWTNGRGGQAGPTPVGALDGVVAGVSHSHSKISRRGAFYVGPSARHRLSRVSGAVASTLGATPSIDFQPEIR